MTRKERLALIEKFRKGQLEGIALQRFEQMLEEDRQLSRELELDQEMSEALDDHSDYNLFRKLMKEAEKEYFTPKKPRFWNPIRVAAAIILMMTVGGGLWWLSIPASSPEQLFAQHFEAYPAPSNFRGDQMIKLNEDFMLGLVRYDDEQYAEAITLFNKALQSDQENYTAQFLTAVAHMALKQFQEAETIFLAMEPDDRHLFQDQCRWYLGLLYLSDGDPENDSMAQFYLNRINTPALVEKSKAFQ